MEGDDGIQKQNRKKCSEFRRTSTISMRRLKFVPNIKCRGKRGKRDTHGGQERVAGRNKDQEIKFSFASHVQMATYGLAAFYL